MLNRTDDTNTRHYSATVDHTEERHALKLQSMLIIADC